MSAHSRGPATGAAPPVVERKEAIRLLRAARRLYDAADAAQSGNTTGTDSATMAYRALELLFRLVARIHGDSPERPFEDLSELARRIAAAENLTADDLGGDVAVISRMRAHFVEETDPTPAESRSYRRAFVRCLDWFDGANDYLEERLPAAPSRTRLPALALAVLAAFAFGSVFARKRALNRRDFRSENHGVTVSIASPALSCTGCYDPENAGANVFAWTTGRADFVLEGLSAGAYRIELRITDSSPAPNLSLRSNRGRFRDVPMAHDDVALPDVVIVGPDGMARWSVRVDTFVPKTRFPTIADDRELGVAIAAVTVHPAGTAAP